MYFVHMYVSNAYMSYFTKRNAFTYVGDFPGYVRPLNDKPLESG